MALLDVRIYGDPCLKEKSTPVEEFDEVLAELVGDMVDTLYHTRGIGPGRGPGGSQYPSVRHGCGLGGP